MSLLFRSFYALPPMNTADGTPTNALYGLSSLFLKLIREHRPRALAFAVDLPKPTFRHVAYPDYKQGRAKKPDPLRQQLARFGQWMASLQVPVHAQEGFEADDVIATLATKLDDVLVVSGDTDLFQVVTDDVRVWFVGRRQRDAVMMDRAAVEARYTVGATSIPTIKALMGDSSDNLPGLHGVGVKTAASWIRAHGDAQGIVDAVAHLTPARHRPIVQAHAADLVTWEELATVRRDVPLDGPWAAPLTAASFAGLDAEFEALELQSLRPRLARIVADLEHESS